MQKEKRSEKEGVQKDEVIADQEDVENGAMRGDIYFRKKK